MLLQFTTGSLEDRQKSEIQISVFNAGEVPASVVCTFTKFKGDSRESVKEHIAKVPPQSEQVVLDESDMSDVHCDVVFKVDSSSLIITIMGEMRHPIHCQTVLVENVEAHAADHDPCPGCGSLFWGYTSKGDPF